MVTVCYFCAAEWASAVSNSCSLLVTQPGVPSDRQAISTVTASVILLLRYDEGSHAEVLDMCPSRLQLSPAPLGSEMPSPSEAKACILLGSGVASWVDTADRAPCPVRYATRPRCMYRVGSLTSSSDLCLLYHADTQGLDRPPPGQFSVICFSKG